MLRTENDRLQCALDNSPGHRAMSVSSFMTILSRDGARILVPPLWQGFGLQKDRCNMGNYCANFIG